MGTSSFPGVKRKAVALTTHLPPPSAEVKERVQLYVYSLSGSSCPVLGWTTLTFHIHFLRPPKFCWPWTAAPLPPPPPPRTSERGTVLLCTHAAYVSFLTRSRTAKWTALPAATQTGVRLRGGGSCRSCGCATGYSSTAIMTVCDNA
jgi:hypothetical protein